MEDAAKKEGPTFVQHVIGDSKSGQYLESISKIVGKTTTGSLLLYQRY